MTTSMLTLKLNQSTNLYQTRWTDDQGNRHKRTFGSNKVQARIVFADFLAKWITTPTVKTPLDPDELMSVKEMIERFNEYAEDYYRHSDGTHTRDHLNYFYATRELRELFGELEASSIGCKEIKKVQQAMIAIDLARKTINERIRRIKHVFLWAFNEEYITDVCLLRVKSVPPLKANRCGARETGRVHAIADSIIDLTCQHTSPTVKAMIMTQRLTGMRPGELVIMRPCDIDTTGPVWIYKPSHHKLSHIDKERVIAIGPTAQKYITPCLPHDLTAAVFNPLKSRHEREVTHGRTIGRLKPRKTDRRVRDHYDVQSYYRAICYACKNAGIATWSPNKLRHAWATEARRLGNGLDHVQNQLGHSDIKTTQIYAGLNMEKAVEYVQKHG
ncbi:site-specific integrase [bacterium AH-315-I18]|nr:site-specific integrase [Phycisphaeraceae bacterium]MBN4061087.1 site-specific integrase [bacterium AH-315-I18]